MVSIDLKCVNPNYLQVSTILLPSVLNGSKRRVQFIDRETYLKGKNTLYVNYYMTRCGKCLACRIYKGYEWSNRLQAEAKKWPFVYFITFTFNDQNLEKVDLKKPMREFQLFMKRLRKKFKDLKFKYYATAELGGETLRFHYHSILFSDFPIFNDWYKYKKTAKAQYYISPTLNQIWGNGYAPLTYAEGNSMRYCANYVNKGGFLAHSFSKGLGADYISENISSFSNSTYLINGSFSKIPRYIKMKKNLFISLQELEKSRELESIDVSHEFADIRERLIDKNFYRKKT